MAFFGPTLESGIKKCPCTQYPVSENQYDTHILINALILRTLGLKEAIWSNYSETFFHSSTSQPHCDS